MEEKRSQSSLMEIKASPDSRPVHKSLLSASAAGAAFLVLIQRLSRLLTFVMNQLLVRYLSPSTLGVAAQLELYMITILYFSRESLRMALQRQVEGPPAEKEENAGFGQPDGKIVEGTSLGQSQTVVNLSYLVLPIGVVVAGLMQISYVGVSTEETTSQPYFRESVFIYTIATVMEL